jgi:TolB-like protein
MHYILRNSFILTLLFISKLSFAQSDYEKQISIMANVIAEKITQSGNKRVAVAEFTDNNGFQNELGKAMAEEFSVNLMNAAKGFQVMERSDLNLILKENSLSTTGLIDPETAKKLGKLKAVDLVIIGSITPFSEYFRMSIKVLDTETGMAIGGTLGNIARIGPLNLLFGNKLENTVEKKNGTSPVNTYKQEKLETGDFCFNNKAVIQYIYLKGYKVKVDILSIADSKILRTINVEQSETACIYELPVGIYKIQLTWHSKDHQDDDNRSDVKEYKEIRVRAGKNNSIDLIH